MKLRAVPCGALALAATTGCGSDTSKCEAGPFPKAPSESAGHVYVSGSCPGDSPDGSKGQPFATISEALAAAGRGDAVLVDEGKYREALRIDRPVAIVGSTDPKSPARAVVVLSTEQPHAVLVDGATGVTLRGLHVASPTATGIWVRGGSATLEGVRVEGAAADAAGLLGYGVAATDGATITLRDSEVVRSQSTGVFLHEATGEIVGSTISENERGGVRLQRSSGQVRIEGNELTANLEFGIGSFSSMAIIVQNKVASTGLGTVSADGILVGTLQGETTGSDVEVRGNEVSDSGRTGILFGRGALGSIVDNEVLGNGSDEVGFGAGAWIQQGAAETVGIIVQNNEFRKNAYVGVGVTGGARAVVAGNTVADTEQGRVLSGVGLDVSFVGDGVGVFAGASAQIDRGNVIEGSFRSGIITDAALGASTTIAGNTIRNNDLAVILQDQDGDAVDVGADNSMSGNRTSNDVQQAAAGTYVVEDGPLGGPDRGDPPD